MPRNIEIEEMEKAMPWTGMAGISMAGVRKNRNNTIFSFQRDRALRPCEQANSDSPAGRWTGWKEGW